METTQINIKNGKPEDRDYLKNLATSMGITVADALSYIISKAKSAESQESKQEANEETQQIIRDLTTQNAQLVREHEAQAPIIQERHELFRQVNELSLKLSELESKAPETVEKIIEVEKVLEPHQFICDLGRDTALKVRKSRKYAKESGIVDPDIQDKEYPNAFVSVATEYFLHKKFNDII